MNCTDSGPHRSPPSLLPPVGTERAAGGVEDGPPAKGPRGEGPRVEDAAVARTVERLLAGDRASAAAGIRLLEAGPGRARLEMTVRPDMTNGHGTCHGGFVFLLADTAFAVACNSHGPAAVAASCDIVYLRPVRVGDTLVAEAHERTTAGRSGITDVTVRRTAPSGGGQLPLSAGDAAGEVVAEFRGRSRVVKGSPAGEPDGRRGPTGTESDGAPDAEPVTSDTRNSEGAPIPLPELSQPDPLD